jgi:hypothetical protein
VDRISTTTIADLSAFRFIAGPTGGLNTTLSNIATLGNFITYNMPMPIIVADRIVPGDVEYYGLPIPYYNATIVSFAHEIFHFWY